MANIHVKYFIRFHPYNNNNLILTNLVRIKLKNT